MNGVDGVDGWLGRLKGTRAARLASAVGVLLVVAAFALLVGRAVELGFFDRQPFWVADAIPAVISELYYGHTKRYTALESVNRRFHARVDREVATARQINAAIRRLEETANEDPDPGYVLLGPDDKGIVDLIKGGFVLFGARTESIVAFYFTLLLLSCGLYIVAYWRSPSALLLLAAFLGMFYLVMPMIMHNGQLRSILALRALPILSMVACLHVLLFVASSLHTPVRAWQAVPVALQVLLITFAIHLRSTTLWQVATILGFGAVVVLVAVLKKAPTPRPSRPAAREEKQTDESQAASRPGARGRGWGIPRPVLAAGIAVGLMVGGYLGLQAYHAVALPEEYRRGDEIATRVFWHNVFTGFAYHPGLQERFRIWLDDVSIIAATGRYLVETDQEDRWLEMGGKLPVPGEADGAASFEGIKFAKYDPAVKEMLVARCTTLVRECLETLLWYKPLSLAGNLAWLYGVRQLPPDLEVTESPYFGDILKRQILGMTDGLDGRGWRAYLWTPRILLIVLPFVVLLLAETRERARAACWACLGLACGSTIPTVAGYAAPHTISESAIVFGMLAYLGVCVALATGLRKLMAGDRAPSPRRAAATVPSAVGAPGSASPPS